MLFVRKTVNGRWLTNPPWTDSGNYLSPDWLAGGEVRADCLADLKTEAGRLSVFRVDADNKEKIGRVGAALISTNKLENFDYCLIDSELLDRLGIKRDQCDGKTADAEVSSAHFDLVELTVSGISALARELKRTGTRGRIQEKEIGRQIAAGISAGRIDRARVDPKVLAKLAL